MAEVPLQRIVLAHRIDGPAGVQWTGAEPAGMYRPEDAILCGAQWEGDELVTYNLPALHHQFSRLDDPFLNDVD